MPATRSDHTASGVDKKIIKGYLIMRPRRSVENSSGSSKFLSRNAEMLLRKQISFSQGRRSNPIRTFTLAELQEATHNFDGRRHLLDFGPPELGCEHYWGILDDRKVAIKNITKTDNADFLVEAHITEIVILSNICHRNVVKLLGCCLETQVPLLVYEFVPGGSLESHMKLIWKRGKYLTDWVAKRVEHPPWSTRLQIATDVAEALNYLHSFTSRPVVHRDVKVSTILLDEDYTAKLTGFGLSFPIPPGETQVKDARVAGTMGYLDPEYITTCTLTEKADIFSFGRVLLELLTGVSISSLSREADITDGWLENFVADAVALGDAEGKTEQLAAFGGLALQCCSFRGEERPTMKYVVEKLRRIRCMGLS